MRNREMRLARRGGEHQVLKLYYKKQVPEQND